MELGLMGCIFDRVILSLTIIISALALLSFDISPGTYGKNRAGLSLKETFKIYIKSVQNSDLEGLFSTITDKDDFFFLTAKGKLIDTREGYYKFHEDWFKETEWEMPVELIRIHEGEEYGYTTAIFYYKSKNPDGITYNLDSYFTLIFHKEDYMWKVISDICTPINRYITEENQEIKYDEKQTYLLNIIKNRRTVRKFKSTPVLEKHIIKILDAARFAPTAGNQQPWKFLVIRNRKKLDQLKEEALLWYLELYKEKIKPSEKELEDVGKAVRNALEDALSAPVYVAVLVDSEAKYPDYIIHDGTLAASYIMIAARALGYGTGFYTAFFPDEKMKEFFNIPEKYRLICFTPIGIPFEWPEVPPKKKLEDLVIFESF